MHQIGLWIKKSLKKYFHEKAAKTTWFTRVKLMRSESLMFYDAVE